MTEQTQNKKNLKQKLTHKYRMVLINEDTFEEKLSFKMSRLNVFITTGIIAIVLISLTAVLISFTSLKEYIPGYSSLKLKQQTNELILKIDSLETILEVNNRYISNFQNVLMDDVTAFKFDKDSVFETLQFNQDSLSIDNSELDSIFRLEVESEDKYSFFDEAKKDVGIVFFAPVTGKITQGYDINLRHFAVDVVVKTGTPVKAVADGTVIFSEWTAATGHVIVLQHTKKYISIYKHNGGLHKQQGDLVKSGEVIASSGSTGELTTGPHLHFELWNDGYPVNPTNFIDFE